MIMIQNLLLNLFSFFCDIYSRILELFISTFNFIEQSIIRIKIYEKWAFVLTIFLSKSPFLQLRVNISAGNSSGTNFALATFYDVHSFRYFISLLQEFTILKYDLFHIYGQRHEVLITDLWEQINTFEENYFFRQLFFFV